MTGSVVFLLTSRVTFAASFGSVPKAIPPLVTLGHEIFTSIALTPGTVRAYAT